MPAIMMAYFFGWVFQRVFSGSFAALRTGLLFGSHIMFILIKGENEGANKTALMHPGRNGRTSGSMRGGQHNSFCRLAPLD